MLILTRTGTRQLSTLLNPSIRRNMASISSLADPGEELPRDPTGSYLHLKLKRFPSIKDLTMPYARKTWQQMPHDAAVAKAPNGRALCRHCHETIEKGALRYQLLLQCHKGCKTSAFFHANCVWKYPETRKITKVEEFAGLDNLPLQEKKSVLKQFEEFSKAHPKHESTGKTAMSGNTTAKRKSGSKDSASSKKSKKRN